MLPRARLVGDALLTCPTGARDGPAHMRPGHRQSGARRSEAVHARFDRPPSRTAARLLSASPFSRCLPSSSPISRSAGSTKSSATLVPALDDSFIHFQYARALADGHPFRYEAGEPRTMGATSALWPLVSRPVLRARRGRAAHPVACVGLLIRRARAPRARGRRARPSSCWLSRSRRRRRDDARFQPVRLVRGERDGGRAVRTRAHPRGSTK